MLREEALQKDRQSLTDRTDFAVTHNRRSCQQRNIMRRRMELS